MASYTRLRDVGASLSRPSKKHQAERYRGGRWPEGGGPISGLSRSDLNGRSWLSSCRMKLGGAGNGVGARGVVRTRGWGRGPARRGLTVRAFDLTL